MKYFVFNVIHFFKNLFFNQLFWNIWYSRFTTLLYKQRHFNLTLAIINLIEYKLYAIYLTFVGIMYNFCELKNNTFKTEEEMLFWEYFKTFWDGNLFPDYRDNLLFLLCVCNPYQVKSKIIFHNLKKYLKRDNSFQILQIYTSSFPKFLFLLQFSYLRVKMLCVTNISLQQQQLTKSRNWTLQYVTLLNHWRAVNVQY